MRRPSVAAHNNNKRPTHEIAAKRYRYFELLAHFAINFKNMIKLWWYGRIHWDMGIEREIIMQLRAGFCCCCLLLVAPASSFKRFFFFYYIFIIFAFLLPHRFHFNNNQAFLMCLHQSVMPNHICIVHAKYLNNKIVVPFRSALTFRNHIYRMGCGRCNAKHYGD